MTAERRAVLVLEGGRVFRGAALGARGEAFGEAVFNTSLTGYQEILTDPSYAGQIVVMTAAQIGNTGVNAEDVESARPACAGFAVREGSPLVSNWRARGDLDAYLAEHGVVGIEGIDTRALTRALRTGGAQKSAISTRVHSDDDIAALIARVKQSPGMEGQDLTAQVTCAARHEWPASQGAWRAPDMAAVLDADGHAAQAAPSAEPAFHVAAYDFGIKHTILRDLTSMGCRVTVLPAHTPASEALALDVDGYFLSNGPGDPAAVTYAIDAVRALIDSGKPVFGICLGHQILALALGATTYKLPFGHHGGNHPVKDLATGQVAITAQNHGFAVAAGSLPAGVSCTHINLYDDTVEGIQVDGRPVFSVQYHPEAGPGPHDAEDLFSRFLDTMRHARQAQHR